MFSTSKFHLNFAFRAMWLSMVTALLLLVTFSHSVGAEAPRKQPQAMAQREKSNSNRQKDISNFLSRVFSNYRKNEAPSRGIKVRVNMLVLSIHNIDVNNMEYTADLYLRMKWKDPRLSWGSIREFSDFKMNILISHLKNKVWLPDLFFRNGRSGRTLEVPSSQHLLRLSPNGNILFSQKISMRFSCQMNLTNFPFDTQECKMNIGSYKYTYDTLFFEWYSSYNKVNFDSNIKISEFKSPKRAVTKDCTVGTSTGKYTCLEASFTLVRKLSGYLTTIYTASTLLIIISWSSFILNVDAVTARVGVVMTTLLGVILQRTSLIGQLPKTSDTTALDRWMNTSLIFVVAAFLVNVLAVFIQTSLKNICCHLKRDQKYKRKTNTDKETEENEDNSINTELASARKPRKSAPDWLKLILGKLFLRVIDILAIVIFPLAFHNFNKTYWSYYLK